MFLIVLPTWSEPPRVAGAQSMVLGAQGVPQTAQPSWALGHLSLVCTTETQLPYQAFYKKKDLFLFA